MVYFLIGNHLIADGFVTDDLLNGEDRMGPAVDLFHLRRPAWAFATVPYPGIKSNMSKTI